MKAMAILLEEAKATDSGRPEEPYYCPTERESGQVGVRPTGQPFPQPPPFLLRPAPLPAPSPSTSKNCRISELKQPLKSVKSTFLSWQMLKDTQNF